MPLKCFNFLIDDTDSRRGDFIAQLLKYQLLLHSLIYTNVVEFDSGTSNYATVNLDRLRLWTNQN